MSATIELDGVSKSFGGIHAVRDVSFSLKRGEVTALVGHNGAGKTTLIKLMLGLIRASAGSVKVLGAAPAETAGVRTRLGYLPESVSFNPALTGRETLHFYAALKRAGGGQVKALLERVGLAQALIGEPEVLLLDEPTTGLDPALRRDFYGFLDTLRAAGATILLSSHALSELEGCADRVIIMGSGVKLADGTLDELRQIARLPTRIRVKLAEGEERRLDGSEGWRAVNGRTLEIDAAPEEKVALLRSAVGQQIADLDVTPPTLDALYAHFQDMGKASR